MWRHASSTDSVMTGEGEQSYMASAADLMIGLLFVFIIMVAFLALQKKVEQEGRRGDRDPRGSVTIAIGNEVRDDLPTVRVDPASGVITLPEELLFDIGSSVLKASAVEKLSETSKKLEEVLRCYVANQIKNHPCKNNPNGHQIETIFIEGHTDSRPMNRPGGNIKLSLDRAISVNAALVRGTPLEQFKNQNGDPIFSYSAYAATRLLNKNDPTDGKNRRVDLRIVLTYRPTETDTAIEVVNQTMVKN